MSKTKKENENACNINFVLDTNFYLHYKRFTELDWKSLLGCNNLTLIVPPTVITELDDKKFTAQDSRIKRRAQEVISKFRDISEGKSIPRGFQINFLESSIEEIALRDLHLNPENSDDKIIAATLAVKEQTADEEVLIVSADFGMQLKAKSHGIKVVLPQNDWKRETKDSRDKKIVSLQAELQKYQNALPDVQLCFSTEDNLLPFIKIYKDRLLEGILTDEDIEAKLEQERTEVKPIGTVNTINTGFISKKEIRIYNGAVREYIGEYRKYLNDVKEIQELCLTIELSPVLVNKGNSPAENVDIFLKFPNDWVNFPKLFEEAKLLKFPEKPARPTLPKSDIASILGGFQTLSELMPIPTISPHAERKPVNQIGPEINKSRMSVHYWLGNLKHGMRIELKPLYVWYSSINTINTFKIEYSISCGNHPKVKEGELAVVIKNEETSDH